MDDAPRYVTLRDYLQVVRAHRVLILICAVVFAGAAFLLSARQDAVYAVEAALAFNDPTQDLELLGTPTTRGQSAEQRAAIGADLVERQEVVRSAGDQLGRQDFDALRDAVSAAPEARTNLVVIEARSTSARDAARIANAYARAVRDVATLQERDRLEDISVKLRREYRNAARGADRVTRTIFAERLARIDALRDFARPVEIARSAAVPKNPVDPKPVRNTLLGLLVGLTLGLIAAFGRDAMDRRLRSSRQIQQESAVPLLAHLSSDGLGGSVAGLDGKRPLPDADREAMRILRTNLTYLAPDARLRTLLVTSAMPEEGKSTVASSLAAAATAAGERTLLLECDLRRPSLAGRLGLDPQPGLSDLMAGTHARPAVEQILDDDEGGESLTVITAGSPTARASELLGSRRFAAFLQEVRDAYDFVILDGTPLLSVVDARELLPRVDGVVLCIRSTRITRDQLRSVRAALDNLPDRPTGLVVTGVDAGDEGEYGYYGYAYEAARR